MEGWRGRESGLRRFEKMPSICCIGVSVGKDMGRSASYCAKGRDDLLGGCDAISRRADTQASST